MSIFLKKASLRLFPLAYMAIIWYQSGHFRTEAAAELPLFALVPLGLLFEAGHLFQFGILYAALVAAFVTFGPLTKRKERAALSISLLYAALDETHQYFVPFRTASWGDMAKDTFGIMACWAGLRLAYASQTSRIGRWLRRLEAMSDR